MDANNLAVAVTAWQEALGAEHVLTAGEPLAAYARNVSGLSRVIPAVLRPGSTAEVQQIVRIANQFLIPLHPISGGCNWGFGSRLPVQDGVVVVDLSRMNRIHEVNVASHYAVVEPGVTQGQLCDHLRAQRLPLVLNVTGTARGASLIGNALERGIGYFASRADSLAGLEVVLGNGALLRTGFGHMAGARTAYAYRPGIGPDLGGLLAQSNFGIVTSAGVDLMPQLDATMVVIAKIDREEKLGRFIHALADLRRREIIRTVFHVGNRGRTRIALGPLVYDQLARLDPALDPPARRQQAERMIDAAGFGPWSAVGGVMGTRGQLRDARREIRRALRGLARPLFITDRLVQAAKALSRPLAFLPWVRAQRIMLLAVEPLCGLALGVPTDECVKTVYWPVGAMPHSASDNPDLDYGGMLYCVPFLPPDGRVAQEAVELTRRVYARHGFEPFITLNLVDSRSLEGVINMAFDRRQPEQVAAAHAANDELTAEFIRRGYPPYRVGVQNMDLVVEPHDTFWQLVRDLKQVFDPHHIISPGRYNLV
ncbi:MAG: FAD-binding oxidoreductase [Kiritimatiellaeota bacterium]|nr:FAD-binding oxidoreductase [Kiritimatiellota bacterium]